MRPGEPYADGAPAGQQTGLFGIGERLPTREASMPILLVIHEAGPGKIISARGAGILGLMTSAARVHAGACALHRPSAQLVGRFLEFIERFLAAAVRWRGCPKPPVDLPVSCGWRAIDDDMEVVEAGRCFARACFSRAVNQTWSLARVPWPNPIWPPINSINCLEIASPRRCPARRVPDGRGRIGRADKYRRECPCRALQSEGPHGSPFVTD